MPPTTAVLAAGLTCSTRVNAEGSSGATAGRPPAGPVNRNRLEVRLASLTLLPGGAAA